jgi:hypothetical protein
MTDLTLPSIHLNGTGRRMLTEDYTTAYYALQTAIRAFQSIEFNARDYYPQGADAFYQARSQRDIQLQHLSGVQHYLETHLMHLGE